MALPTWPTSLPPIRGTQQGSGSPGLYPGGAVSEFESGDDRTRRKYLGRPPTPLQVEFEFDLSMLQIFDDFFEFTINMGNSIFVAPVLTPSGFVVPKMCKFDMSQKQVGALRWVSGLAPRPTFIVKVWDWRGFEKETRAFFGNVAPTTWEDSRKIALNNLVAELKQEGVWDRLGMLHLYAAHTRTAADRNVRDRATMLVTRNGDPLPAWTKVNGYAGDGAQSYLDLGAGWASLPGVSVDNFSLFGWMMTSGSVAGREVGTVSGNGTSIIALSGANFGVRANSGTQFNNPEVDGRGLFGFSRSGADVNVYKNGALLNSYTEAPTAFGAGNAAVGKSGTSFSGRSVSVVVAGQSITQAQSASLYNALRKYLVANGSLTA